MSIHDQVDENLILQIRLAALDDQRVNNSVTLEMLTQEKVRFYTSWIMNVLIERASYLSKSSNLHFRTKKSKTNKNNNERKYFVNVADFRLSVCRWPTGYVRWLANGFQSFERTKFSPLSKWLTRPVSFRSLGDRRPAGCLNRAGLFWRLFARPWLVDTTKLPHTDSHGPDCLISRFCVAFFVCFFSVSKFMIYRSNRQLTIGFLSFSSFFNSLFGFGILWSCRIFAFPLYK